MLLSAKNKKTAYSVDEGQDNAYYKVYTKLANNRIIFVNEIITKDTASSLSALFLYYDNESDDEITMYINTDGGDADAISHIYDVMQMIKSPIKTICLGKAYSAGSIMLATGTKGRRYITKNSKVLLHGIQSSHPFGSGDKKDCDIYYKYLDFNNKYIMQVLANHTGQKLEKIIKDCSRDLFLDAKQAKEYGVVDHII